MHYKDQKSTYLSFILIFVAVKIGLNFLAIAHFGFHRDELLHLVLADHLDWGYKEVPPFIGLLAKISNFSFGDSVFAARVFPTIFSGLIILLTGLITVEFGGKKFAIAVAANFLLLPIVLPVLPLNQTLAYFRFTREKLPGINFIVTWEDHKLHATTQDYADMMGWNEMAAEVNQAWKSLTPEQQKHTQIYADNYGEAGAIHHFSKQYHLPDVISLNSSFTLWAPDNLGAQYIIYVDNKDGGNIKKFASYLESYRKIGEVHNPLAVENGTGVFLLVHPLPQLNERYRTELLRKRLE